MCADREREPKIGGQGRGRWRSPPRLGASLRVSGSIRTDAASIPTDSASTPVDSGSIPTDSASTPMDSGSIPTDSASTPIDSASTAMDSGSTPIGSASIAIVPSPDARQSAPWSFHNIKQLLVGQWDSGTAPSPSVTPSREGRFHWNFAAQSARSPGVWSASLERLGYCPTVPLSHYPPGSWFGASGTPMERNASVPRRTPAHGCKRPQHGRFLAESFLQCVFPPR